MKFSIVMLTLVIQMFYCKQLYAQKPEVPVGPKHKYKVGDEIMDFNELRNYLIKQPISTELARKSKKLAVTGGVMWLSGTALMLVGTGIIISSFLVKDSSDALFWTGISIDLIGTSIIVAGVLLGKRGLKYYQVAVKKYNIHCVKFQVQPIVLYK